MWCLGVPLGQRPGRNCRERNSERRAFLHQKRSPLAAGSQFCRQKQSGSLAICSRVVCATLEHSAPQVMRAAHACCAANDLRVLLTVELERFVVCLCVPTERATRTCVAQKRLRLHSTSTRTRTGQVNIAATHAHTSHAVHPCLTCCVRVL